MVGHLDESTKEALSHIERNGNLAWMDLPTPEVSRLYDDLGAKGYVERNPWSGRLVLTRKAEAARRDARELDKLMRFCESVTGSRQGR